MNKKIFLFPIFICCIVSIFLFLTLSFVSHYNAGYLGYDAGDGTGGHQYSIPVSIQGFFSDYLMTDSLLIDKIIIYGVLLGIIISIFYLSLRKKIDFPLLPLFKKCLIFGITLSIIGIAIFFIQLERGLYQNVFERIFYLLPSHEQYGRDAGFAVVIGLGYFILGALIGVIDQIICYLLDFSPIKRSHKYIFKFFSYFALIEIIIFICFILPFMVVTLWGLVTNITLTFNELPFTLIYLIPFAPNIVALLLLTSINTSLLKRYDDPVEVYKKKPVGGIIGLFLLNIALFCGGIAFYFLTWKNW